jgi:plasmid maintenance system antidote protein VapI
MARKSETMSDVLRKAIAESGIAYIALERATGVQRMSISRFMRGATSLRLDQADKLAAYFGLKLQKG